MASYLRELYRDPTNRVTTNSSSPLDMLNDTNASSYPETDMTRDGTYDITTFFLVTVFSMFCIFTTLLRLPYCYNRAERIRLQRLDNATRARTPEVIKSMLVLKNVIVSSDDSALDDKDSEKKTSTRVKRHKRRKSNLILRRGRNEEELDQSRTCAICLSNYEEGEKICWSRNQNCTHCFHAQCGIHWLARHTECPVCREQYITDPNETNNDTNTDLSNVNEVMEAGPNSSEMVPEVRSESQEITTIEEV